MRTFSLPLLVASVLVLVTALGCPQPPPTPPPPPPPPAAARSLQVTNSTTALVTPPGPTNPNGRIIPPFTLVPIIYTDQDTTNPNSAYSKARTRGTTADQLRSSNPAETFSGVPVEPNLTSAVAQLTPGQSSVSLLVVGLDPTGHTDGITHATSSLALHDGLNPVTVTGTFGSSLSISASLSTSPR